MHSAEAARSSWHLLYQTLTDGALSDLARGQMLLQLAREFAERDPDVAEQCLAEATARIETLPPQVQAEVWSERAQHHLRAVRLVDAQRDLRTLDQLLAEHDLPALHVEATRMHGELAFRQGNFGAAYAAFRQSSSLAEELGLRGAAATATVAMAAAAGRLYRFEEAFFDFQRAFRHLATPATRLELGFATVSVAELLNQLSLYQQALPFAQFAHRVGTDYNAQRLLSRGKWLLGTYNLQMKQLERAQTYLEAAHQLARIAEDGIRQAYVQQALGRLARKTQQPDAANAQLENAAEVLANLGQDPAAAEGYLELARLHGLHGLPAAGVTFAEKALVHAQRAQDARQQARVHEVLANLHQRLADFSRARRHTGASQTLYQQAPPIALPTVMARAASLAMELRTYLV